MSDQVWKYSSAKEYLDPCFTGGEAVSEKVSFEEAKEIRDRLLVEDPDHYYFIKHYTACSIGSMKSFKESTGKAG